MDIASMVDDYRPIFHEFYGGLGIRNEFRYDVPLA